MKAFEIWNESMARAEGVEFAPGGFVVLHWIDRPNISMYKNMKKLADDLDAWEEVKWLGVEPLVPMVSQALYESECIARDNALERWRQAEVQITTLKQDLGELQTHAKQVEELAEEQGKRIKQFEQQASFGSNGYIIQPKGSYLQITNTNEPGCWTLSKPLSWWFALAKAALE